MWEDFWSQERRTVGAPSKGSASSCRGSGGCPEELQPGPESMQESTPERKKGKKTISDEEVPRPRAGKEDPMLRVHVTQPWDERLEKAGLRVHKAV